MISKEPIHVTLAPKRGFDATIFRKQGTITRDDIGDTIFGGRKKIAQFEREREQRGHKEREIKRERERERERAETERESRQRERERESRESIKRER